jgi:hypothetical protein
MNNDSGGQGLRFFCAVFFVRIFMTKDAGFVICIENNYG